MMETLEQTFCRDCGQPIILPLKRGPRLREFCDATCRQRWHRKHQAQPSKNSRHDDITMEAQARIAELERELAEANDLIEKLTSKKSTTPLKRSYQERLERWGEKLDYPALDIHVRIQPGRKNWRVFKLNESNDQLIRAIIAAERTEERRNQS